MTPPSAADAEIRNRAFVAVVRSRLLRLRLDEACRRASWLRARTRYMLKRWPDRFTQARA